MSATAVVLATALLLSPVSEAPPPTYVLDGTDVTGQAGEGDVGWLLNGYLAGGRFVDYPRSLYGVDASVQIGAQAIFQVIAHAQGPIRVAGVSQGAMAVAEAKRMIMALDEADRPAPADLTFVAIADPTSASGAGGRFPGVRIPNWDATLRPAPETPYDTVFVTREYDAAGDFPDRPLNLISSLNALAGFYYIHADYGPSIDLDEIPAEHVTVTTNSLGARNTTYLVLTEDLPLLQPLRDMNVDQRIIDSIEPGLRRIVDAGYSRNDGRDDDPDDKPLTARDKALESKRAAARSADTDSSEKKADKSGKDSADKAAP